MHAANDMISRADRKSLYEAAETIDPDEIETGMFVIGPKPAFVIEQIVDRARPGEKLSRNHAYSYSMVGGGHDCGQFEDRDCVSLSFDEAPRGPEQVANHYRDVTEQVYNRL